MRTLDKSHIILFCLIWALVGCSNQSNGPDEQLTGEISLNGAKVVNLSNLPECNEDSEGALFYVLEDSEFKYCDGESYITINLQGDSGISLNWLGSLVEKPDSPELYDVYYNSTDKKVYIWNGSEWDMLVADGNSCVAESIDEGIEVSCGGEVIDTLEHGVDGLEGDPGENGTSCEATPIENGVEVSCAGEIVDTVRHGSEGLPGENGDSCEGNLIENGIEILCGGEVVDSIMNGTDGESGSDGKPIIWQGEATSHPSSPDTNWAYYNSTDNISYIFDGSEWDTLAVGGQDFDPDVDTLNVNQISGLLGQGFTLEFPDVLHSTTTFELEGIVISNPVLIVSGPGWDIKRIPLFNQSSQPQAKLGPAQEHHLIIETGTADTVNLKAYFNTYTSNDAAKSFSILILDASKVERARWNGYDFKPVSFAPGNDGRVRFEFQQKNVPDNVAHYDLDTDIFGSAGSNNPDTDTEVEIAGITGSGFFPEVVIDSSARTLTFTYDINDGNGIYNWVKTHVTGLQDNRTLSLIYRNSQGGETLRLNYYECWPIKYESLEGFGLDVTLKARVTLSYDVWQEAK